MLSRGLPDAFPIAARPLNVSWMLIHAQSSPAIGQISGRHRGNFPMSSGCLRPGLSDPPKCFSMTPPGFPVSPDAFPVAVRPPRCFPDTSQRPPSRTSGRQRGGIRKVPRIPSRCVPDCSPIDTQYGRARDTTGQNGRRQDENGDDDDDDGDSEDYYVVYSAGSTSARPKRQEYTRLKKRLTC